MLLCLHTCLSLCAVTYLQPGCWASNEPVSSPDPLCVATKLLDRRWTYDWKNGSYCLQSNWRAPKQSRFYNSSSTFVCWVSHWHCSIRHKWSAVCSCEVMTSFFFFLSMVQIKACFLIVLILVSSCVWKLYNWQLIQSQHKCYEDRLNSMMASYLCLRHRWKGNTKCILGK
jgi:hypothetical protein